MNEVVNSAVHTDSPIHIEVTQDGKKVEGDLKFSQDGVGSDTSAPVKQ